MKKDEFIAKKNQLSKKYEFARKDEFVATKKEVVAEFNGTTSALKHVGENKARGELPVCRALSWCHISI